MRCSFAFAETDEYTSAVWKNQQTAVDLSR
jgi:hypothetical protein